MEQWREFVAGSEEEDGSDDEAVGGGEGGDEGLEAGAMGAGGEDSGGCGGHEGVHDEEAGDEAEEAEEAAAGSAEVGGEEEEEELRGSFGAEPVDDAYGEDGAAVVAEGEGVGLGGVRVAEAAETPGDVAGSGDEQGDAAFWDGVMMGAGFAAQEADEDIDGEEDEGRSDEALADGVHVRREAEVEEDDGGAEDGDGEGVAEGVEEAEAHGVAPVALDAGDVGDGGEVVVVEAVAETKEGAGDQGEFERGGHPV
ncbi:MAG: hypothetical protein JWQ42_2460 [Edaphobacter sp.]|nr:hypothetical protein [Edaphobacter sp.]